ncbi:MAG: transglycosylase SLT domain-containing protein [Bacteroidia bacterium]|jgi:membrane-bound lytic murein transglycosylase D|nr:transglycosylase SLT domain-containing protein [Bacteroidia bacterium]
MKKLLSITATVLMACSIQVNAQLLDEKTTAMHAVDTHTLKLYGKLYPQIEQGDLNIYGFEENDVPMYADSVVAYRLSLLESEIPLEYNEYVKPYVNLYTVRKRNLSSKILAWSKYYFPMFEEALDRANMPVELKYLAVIESALNPKATSPVGAAGMWQFMAPTGRMYGLKTNAYYDERRDVIKSTEAAIKYLANSYRIYGDWLLVIASYNCGPGNVNKAIRKAGGVKNFWAIQRFLPAETRGYVPAFIAAAYMMNYASEHNLYPSTEIEIPFHTDTIHVDATYNLTMLAAKLNISIDELIAFNPALRKGILPYGNNKITLTVPYHTAMIFAELNNETFIRTSNDEVLAMNAQIREEQKMVAKRTVKPVAKNYVVKSGDTLQRIAQKNQVSVNELKKWNKIRGNQIKRGQKLVIRG